MRAAIVEYFDQAVEGLGAVYPAKPKNIKATDYYVEGYDFGAIAYPYIETQHERRFEIVGEGQGRRGKWVTYMIGLVVEFRAKARASETAIDNHDSLIDGIVERLCADPLLGTTDGTVFRAGEGDGLGADDIEVVSDLPQHEGDHSTIWSVVRFTVIETPTS